MPVVTYVPSFELVLTRRCAYACGYCYFLGRPSPLPPSRKAAARLVRLASRLGVNQITLSAGEGIAELPEIHRVCRYYGHATWFDFLRDLLSMIVQLRGVRPLVPVLEVGALGFVDLHKMRAHLPALRIMIDSADDRLQYRVSHREAPHKTLEARLAAIECAGRVGVPVITGILVGIGEHPSSWAEAAQAVRSLQERYQHIQEFVIVPFEPMPRTPMELHPAPSDEIVIQACSTVKRILEGCVPVGAEIGRRLHLALPLLEVGIRDFGEIRLGSSEHVATELSAALDELSHELQAKGWLLRPRQTLVNGLVQRRVLPTPVMELLHRQRSYVRRELSQSDRTASAS